MFVIGGSNFGNPNYTNACLKYDVQQEKWNYIASMNGKRFAAACTVFEGKIVVSGGINDHQKLKSVEAYDYHENKWTRLPDMLEKRSNYFLKSLSNKMFVMSRILDQRCEIFDSVSRKFSYVKACTLSERLEWRFYDEQDIFCVGKSIFLFRPRKNCFVVYNFDKSEWFLRPVTC